MAVQKGEKIVPGHQAYSPTRGVPVLSLKQKQEVCKLIAQGLSNTNIEMYLEEAYGLEVSRQVIHKTYRNGRKWKPYINKLLATPDSWKLLPLARKGNRLLLLEKAAQESLTKRYRRRYSKGELVGEEEIVESGNIAPIVREARMEVEGENQTNSVIVNFGYRAPKPPEEKEKKVEKELEDDKSEEEK